VLVLSRTRRPEPWPRARRLGPRRAHGWGPMANVPLPSHLPGRSAVKPCQSGHMKLGARGLGGSEVTFEPMRRRHLPAVIRIEHNAHPKAWSIGVFNSEISQPEGSRYYVVARSGGKVAGYGGLMFVADEAHVTNVAVAPSLRRQGVGTLLLAHLAREATRRGCTAITLEVRVGNVGAQELYKKFGFTAAGVRRNYYPETKEDALIMWLYNLRSPQVQSRISQLESQAHA